MQTLDDKARKLRAQLADLQEQHATGFVTDQQYADFSVYLERRLAEVETELAEKTVPVAPAADPGAAVVAPLSPAGPGGTRRRPVAALAGAAVLMLVVAGAALHAWRSAPDAPALAEPVARAASDAGLTDVAAASASIIDLPASAANPAPLSADPSGGISGVVTLAPALRGRARPEDTLFVFARAVNGPPMPLAVIRKQVKDLPLRFRLDDSQAVWPEAKVSRFAQVVVTARVSPSGEGKAQPGDLQGQSPTVAAGAAGLQIEIASVVGP